MDPYHRSIINLVKTALDEDIGRGDVTSIACLEPNPMKAEIVAKEDGVLSGVDPFMAVFHTVDSANLVKMLKTDSDTFAAGDIIAQVDGFNQTVLASERVALNFLGHLSGVASMTRRFVEKLAGTGCRILDTRKTTPGLRLLEKRAVLHGGGQNHRIGLYDMVLIKDNHIAGAGSICDAVRRTRDFLAGSDCRTQFGPGGKDYEIEVEVSTEAQLREAIRCGVTRLLLDNQSIDGLRRMVQIARELNPKVLLEASGNVTLDNVAEIGATGVDFISSGSLTHSAPTADFSMKVRS